MGRSFLAHAHFLYELMGRHLKSATTSYFWKRFSTFFSSLILQLREFVTQLINTCQDEIYITLQMISQTRIFFQSRVQYPKASFGVLYSPLRGIIRLTLQTSLSSFSASLITTYQFLYALLSELEFHNKIIPQV